MGVLCMQFNFDNEFAWDFFERTGSIESYLLYSEYNKMITRDKNDGDNTD